MSPDGRYLVWAVYEGSRLHMYDLAGDKPAASGYFAAGPAGSAGTSALNFTKGVSLQHGQIADRSAVIANVSSRTINLSMMVTGYFHD